MASFSYLPALYPRNLSFHFQKECRSLTDLKPQYLRIRAGDRKLEIERLISALSEISTPKRLQEGRKRKTRLVTSFRLRTCCRPTTPLSIPVTYGTCSGRSENLLVRSRRRIASCQTKSLTEWLSSHARKTRT